jgi:dolichol-phosphate mannosyltransferase
LTSVRHLQQMPWIRLAGNAVLSLLARAATGYWNVLDPTNGYVAIRSDVFELLPKEYLDNRYFFEMSMLSSLGIAGAVVRDVPMPSKYADETSSLSISVALIEFPSKIFRSFFRRFWYRKILYALTMEALLFILGLMLFMTGSVFGLYNFLYYGFIARAYASPGTVMFAALPMLAGVQLLLNGLMLDIQSVPTHPLSQRITAVFLKKENQG